MPKDFLFEGEDFAQELSKLVREIRDEVLEEFRQEIKQQLKVKVRRELASFGLVESDEECKFSGSELIFGNQAYRPEVTVLSRKISFPDPELTCESNMYITTLDELQGPIPNNQDIMQKDNLLYTYCFTKQENVQVEHIEDIGGGSACSVVKLGEILAIVSPVSDAEFGEEALENNLKNLDWVKEKVQQHERVIEAVMVHGPVVPLKFCTIFRTEERIEEFLHKHYECLKQTIDSISGSDEWGVKVYSHKPTLVRLIGMEKEQSCETGNQGAMYLKRKQLERLIEQEADKYLDNTCQQLFETLKGLADRWVINEPLPKQVTGREEDMLTNVVFLVPKLAVSEFCNAVEEFEQAVAEKGIIVEASGPWPPYHFAEFLEQDYE